MNFVFAYPYSAMLYLFILLVSVLFSFIAQNSKHKIISNLFLFLLILILSSLAGLRDISVGIDTWAYIRAINSASNSYSGELFFTYFEFGFGVLIKILIAILREPHYVILFISLITNTLIIKTLWRYRQNYSFSFSVFLYYTLYYFETFNILRQYLALSIIFWGIKFLYEKKYIKFVIVTLVASSMHGSAIIAITFLPIHFLVEKKMMLKHKILILFSIIGFLFFSNYIMDLIGLSSTIEKYQTFYIQGGAGKSQNFGLFFILRLLVIIFSFYVLKKNGFKNYKFSKFIILVNLLGTTATMSGYIIPYAGRVGTYAAFFEIILWSQLTQIKSKELKFLLKVFFITLSLYLLYSSLKGSTQGHMPYKVFF